MPPKNKISAITDELGFALKFDFNVIFIPVFFAFLSFVNIWPQDINASISDFSRTIIGVSTLNNVDVSHRVTLFYRAFFMAMFIFLSINYVSNRFLLNISTARIEVLSINMLCVLGMLNLLGGMPEMEYTPEIKTVFWLSGILVLVIILSSFSHFSNVLSSNHLLYAGLVALNISLSLRFLGGLSNSTGFFTVFLISILSIILFLKRISKGIFIHRAFQFRFLLLLVPLIVFAQEITFIFNQRDWIRIHPRFWFLIFVSIMWAILFIIARNKRYRREKETLHRIYLPAAVIGTFLFVTYTPFAKASEGLFEMANQANSLMMFIKFNEWPVLDFLPIHLLSDVGYGLLYFFLNGYNGSMDYLAYAFLYKFLLLSLAFLTLHKITGNALFSSAFLLFFPYTEILLWSQSAWVIFLIPFALFFVYRKPDVLSYLLLIFLVVFQMAWKPDTGFAAIWVTALAFFCILALKKETFQLSAISKSIGIFIVLGVLALFIIVFVFNKSLEHIPAALSFYSTSIQARGLAEMAKSYDRIFMFHHIFIPFILLVFSLFSLRKFKLHWKQQPFFYITFLVLVLVYFSNFQRGVTRHNFAEGSDWNLASYSYLALSLIVFMFPLQVYKKLILFCLVGASVIFIVKYPLQPAASSYITRIAEKSDALPVHSAKQISRVSLPADVIENKVKPLEHFFNNRLSPGETYYDFSNTPGVYYYLQKWPPQYFAHTLAITNEQLQEHQIQYLKDNDVPYVIYSHKPRTWWNDTDGVPNEVRLYAIAEYIFRHYKPDTVIANYFIWKKTDLQGIQPGKIESQNFVLGYLPYLLGMQEDEAYQSWNLMPHKSNGTTLTLNSQNTNTPAILQIQIKNMADQNRGYIEYFSQTEVLGKYDFALVPSEKPVSYRIRLSMQYNWIAAKPDSIRIHFSEPEARVVNMNLVMKTPDTN